MNPRRGLALLALGQATLACSGVHEPYDSVTGAIVEGEPSGAEQDGVLLVRALLSDGGESICSASLVAPRLIVTARHCVSYVTEGQFNCSVRGEPINNPDGGGRLGLHLPAESLEVYGMAPPRREPLAHGQQIISTLSPTACRNDLAFVVLDTAIDAPIVPLRLGRSAQVGELGVLVGYGLRQGQDGIDYSSQKRLQKRDLAIKGVGPDSVDDVTTLAPRTILLEGPSGCTGDSGGPLLARDTGALLGVYSLQEGNSCEDAGVRHHLTHVPPFTELIAEAFAAVNDEPLLEPTPSNDAGAGGADGGASTTTTQGGAGATDAGETPSDSNTHDASGCSLSGVPGEAGHDSICLIIVTLFGARRRARRVRFRSAR